MTRRFAAEVADYPGRAAESTMHGPARSVLRKQKLAPGAEDVSNNPSDMTLIRLAGDPDAGDPDAGVREQLASYSGRLPEDATVILAGDSADVVKQALASRDRLPRDVLNWLGLNPNPKIRLETLLPSPDGRVWAGRPREYVVAKLTDPDLAVRDAAVEHWIEFGTGPDNLRRVWEVPPPEIGARLLGERSARVRERARKVFLDFLVLWRASRKVSAPTLPAPR